MHTQVDTQASNIKDICMSSQVTQNTYYKVIDFFCTLNNFCMNTSCDYRDRFHLCDANRPLWEFIAQMGYCMYLARNIYFGTVYSEYLWCLNKYFKFPSWYHRRHISRLFMLINIIANLHYMRIYWIFKTVQEV